MSFEPQPGTTFEPQPETSSEQTATSLEPQSSYLEGMEEEDLNIFLDLETQDDIVYCTEDEEGGDKHKQRKLKGVKKLYKKKFIPGWLKLPEFREWLLKGSKECNL